MIKRLSKDNRGSSLIMALIVIAFVTILGTTMMSMVIATYKLKSMDKISKEAYYTVDTAVDEIYAGLASEAYLQLKEAYQHVVQNLVDTSGIGVGTISNEAANALLRSTYIVYVADALDDASAEDVLKGYVSNTGVTVKTDNELAVVDIGTEKFIEFRDVTLSYVDTSNNYFSQVTLDFVIGYPENGNIEIIDDGITALMTFKDYIFVTDTVVNMAAPNMQINGGVCGNTKVIVSQSAQMNSGNLVSRGEVDVQTVFKHNNGKIWAKDIALNNGKIELMSGSEAYIRDDLTFVSGEGYANSAIIAGSYYGYSGEGAAVGEGNANSSAIIINSEDSVLDLSGVRNLVLKGYGWIKFNAEGSYYRTGESIAIKGDQVAYILPDGWGDDVPVSFYAYALLDAAEVVDNGETVESGLRQYYFKFSSAAYGASFFKSLFDDEEFDKICDARGIADEARATANQDREFFRDQVLANYSTYFAEAEDGTTLGIKINVDSRVYAPGIMFATGYIDSTDAGNTGNYREFDSLTMDVFEDDCIDRYSIISGLLLEMPNDWHHVDGYSDKRVLYDNLKYSHVITETEVALTTKLTDNILKGKAHINNDLYYYPDENGDSVPDNGYFVYVTDDASMNLSTVCGMAGLNKGIIISTGNVYVDCNFTGSIIACGDIVASGAAYSADPELVEKILDELPGIVGYFTNEDVYGGRISFNGLPQGVAPADDTEGDLDAISADDCIKIENYRKGGN